MTDAHDDTVLDRIARAFDGIEPVPDDLRAAAHAAFAWRRADAELAQLLFDSASDELVGVRGTSSARRSFRFGTEHAVIRLHLTDESLVLMIEPPLSVECRIATEQSVDTHRTDEFGELVVPVPEFPVRVEIDLPGGTTHTPWITA